MVGQCEICGKKAYRTANKYDNLCYNCLNNKNRFQLGKRRHNYFPPSITQPFKLKKRVYKVKAGLSYDGGYGELTTDKNNTEYGGRFSKIGLRPVRRRR